MPSLAQVFLRPRKASRQSRPTSLRVPPLTLRLVTWQRMSFSDPLVCRGISGRSSTMSSSRLLAWSRLSRRSRVTKPVRRVKMRSNRARSVALRCQDKYFMYQGIFDTDFDKYTEDAVALFTQTGINTIFEKLEGFPSDWRTNVPAFIKFLREHQCPSFLEYGEYPYVTAVEIKKALKLKRAFSDMLDQMQ